MDGVVAGEVSSGIWERLLCAWALPIHKLQCIHLFFSQTVKKCLGTSGAVMQVVFK